MLHCYRHHRKKCTHFQKGGRYAQNCKCIIWVDGTLTGKRIEQSLKTRNWTRAQEIIREWEAADAITRQDKNATTVERAVAQFLKDLEAQRRSKASLKKYRVLLSNVRPVEKAGEWSPSLMHWCGEQSLQFTTQLGPEQMVNFRAEWKDGAIASAKKLERLRAFGQFLVVQGWWRENHAKGLRSPRITDPPTLPFEVEEVKALLDACDTYPDWHGEIGGEGAKRLRALLLLLRYSGLRIGDAASCSVDRLKDGKLFLYTAKTNTPVYAPLPPVAVQALAECPRKSERYWFWTGVGTLDALTGNWRRTIRNLGSLAGVKNSHPHRFRDTLAVESLLSGTPMEDVSKLLGHSSVKITEKHYAPWVRSRQERMEANVKRAWAEDPLINGPAKVIEMPTKESA